MVKTTTIKIFKANKQFLTDFGINTSLEVKTNDGKAISIDNTNIMSIFPTIYKIKKLNLTIYHYQSNMINDKKYYIVEYNKNYTLNGLKYLLRCLTNSN